MVFNASGTESARAAMALYSTLLFRPYIRLHPPSSQQSPQITLHIRYDQTSIGGTQHQQQCRRPRTKKPVVVRNQSSQIQCKDTSSPVTPRQLGRIAPPLAYVPDCPFAYEQSFDYGLLCGESPGHGLRSILSNNHRWCTRLTF